eukprot:2549798-Prymnesium_polylepis.1
MKGAGSTFCLLCTAGTTSSVILFIGNMLSLVAGIAIATTGLTTLVGAAGIVTPRDARGRRVP